VAARQQAQLGVHQFEEAAGGVAVGLQRVQQLRHLVPRRLVGHRDQGCGIGVGGWTGGGGGHGVLPETNW